MQALSWLSLRPPLARAVGMAAAVAVSDAATGPDPARWAIARATSGSYLRSDGANPAALVGHWAYCQTNANLGQCRKVAWSVPEQGALWMDEPWISALTTSDTLLVTWPFPAIARANVRGLLDLVNEDALPHLTTEVGITLTTVAGQRTYDLTAWRALLDRPERLDGLVLLEPARAVGAPLLESRKRWRVFFDNGAPQLHLLDGGLGSTGKTFGLRGRFPARAWINGAVSTTGIVADTDTLPVGQHDLIRAVLPFAYRALGLGHVPGITDEQRAVYRGLYSEALAEARSLPSWDHIADRLPDRIDADRGVA